MIPPPPPVIRRQVNHDRTAPKQVDPDPMNALVRAATLCVRILSIAFALVVVLLVLLFARSVRGADLPATLERLPGPAEWTGWAIADQAQLSETDRPFQRYLAIPAWGNERWLPALHLTVNTAVSHAQTLHLGTPIANGWMVRYDLRRLVPNAAKLTQTIRTWDELAKQDPYLHVPASNVDLGVAIVSPVIPPEHAATLNNLSLSVGAVYRADWFMVKALSTLNGGAYYDFRQVIRKPEKGSALDAWLSQRGVFVGTTQQVGGERRAAMFRSGVTGKARRVDLFPTLAGGLGSITRDIKDGNIEAGSHPLRNLLRFQDDGSEIIVAQPNGLHDYLLANAAGDIVDEAPPELVRDHTIPPPHTARLQPARSCISCHATETSDGWQPVRNDVQALLKSNLNVFADLSEIGISRDEALDKLAGFYALDVENADGLIGRARRDYSAAVYRCAAGIRFDESKSVVAQVGQLVTSIIHDYDYAEVTPGRAALELGYRPAKDYQGDVLADVLGPIDPTIEADPVVGFLRIGVAVNRSDFETVFGDMATMAKGRK